MRNWKRLLAGAALVAAFACARPAAGVNGTVVPVSVTITNVRDEAQAYVGATDYFWATTLRLTNCIAYSGTSTSSVRQNLTGVTIAVDIGTTVTNVSYSGTAAAGTNGVWNADVVIPSSLATVFLQIKLTDTGTNTYIYPWKLVRTAQSL